jgi:hypothetical protein
MVALKDGNYQHVPIGTLLTGTSLSTWPPSTTPTLPRPLLRVQGMPMFLY